jgi:hypothetical protein
MHLNTNPMQTEGHKQGASVRCMYILGVCCVCMYRFVSQSDSQSVNQSGGQRDSSGIISSGSRIRLLTWSISLLHPTHPSLHASPMDLRRRLPFKRRASKRKRSIRPLQGTALPSPSPSLSLGRTQGESEVRGFESRRELFCRQEQSRSKQAERQQARSKTL